MHLMQGDCLDLMASIPDGSVDMILCDLPYGTTACKWDNVIPFEPLWTHYKRVIKERGAIVLFGSQPFTSALVMSQPKWFKYCWIWDKKLPTGFQLAKYRPMMQHEDIAVFCKTSPFYAPILTPRDKVKVSKRYGQSDSSPLAYDDGKLRSYTHYYPKSILDFSNARQAGKVHPTQKPVPLLEYLIQTYTKPLETVLDNCMGSGSTGVACVNQKRNFIGIEKDPDYFEIAKKRIKEALNMPQQLNIEAI